MTTPARLSSALDDRYQIEREIGAGGMATAYEPVAATSGPSTIAFNEWPVFLMRVDDAPGSLDMPAWVTTHEVSHQWWAHQVIGAGVQGSAVLTSRLPSIPRSW